MSIVQSRRWLRIEICALAAIHLIFGSVIAFASPKVVITQGTVNALSVMPKVLTVDVARILWGAGFAFCAAAIITLAWNATLIAQCATWAIVLWVDGLWSMAFLLPLFVNEGSAPGAVAVSAILTWSTFVLIRVAHGAGE